MKRSTSLLLLACLLSLSFYLPFSNTSSSLHESLQGTPFDLATQSPGILYLTIACASIVFPVLMDYLLDIFFIQNTDMALLERMILLSSIFLTSIVQFISLHTSLANLLYGVSVTSHIWMLTSFAFIQLNRLAPHSFTMLQIITILFFVFAYSLSDIFYLAFPLQNVHILVIVTKYTAFILIILQLTSFAVKTFLDWKSSKVTFVSWIRSADFNTQSSLFFAIVFGCAFLVFAALRYAFKVHEGIKSFSAPFLYGYLCIVIMTSLLITLLPHRLAKAQATKIFSELEIKKTFVRYISHELRTPLSIVMTGLSLVEEQLREGGDRNQVISTIQELRSPCETGVGILDELLNYEKLGAGIAYMEKSTQDPTLFIDQSIGPFKMVARQKNIQLNIRNSICRGQYLVDIDETKVSTCLNVSLSFNHRIRWPRCCATCFRTPSSSLPSREKWRSRSIRRMSSLR